MNVTTFGQASDAQAEPGKVHRNLSVPALVEAAVVRGEGILTATGALAVTTGKYTGRSPKDKFIVDDALTREHVHWGPVNQPFDPERFEALLERAWTHLRSREHFAFDGYAGADPRYRLPIRVISETAYHSLFSHQIFIRPTPEELVGFEPSFTILSVPSLHGVPERDGTRSEVFVLLSFSHRTVLIGGTEYAGEIKKSVFSVLNFLLPAQGVCPMHCSANVGPAGDVALFFGLSGTGKTTLSADPERELLGDDEHGWSDTGIFNFEGGCYAKCIGLREEKEPQIFNAIRFGTVLENVVVDPDSRLCDYDDSSLTENTRACYPLNMIPGARIPSVAGHPQVVIFLTADASGVLPPVSKLTPEQAMYHFLSGYTSKLAGTERGVTTPEPTFSTCFGAPFLPRRPVEYATLLGEHIARHRARVYMVNTGWSGGPPGVGQRMNLQYTRAMVRAILNGSIEQASFSPDPVFKVLVPDQCPGVPSAVLWARQTWTDPAAYDRAARELARVFQQNFDKFNGVSATVAAAGPSA